MSTIINYISSRSNNYILLYALKISELHKGNNQVFFNICTGYLDCKKYALELPHELLWGVSTAISNTLYYMIYTLITYKLYTRKPLVPEIMLFSLIDNLKFSDMKISDKEKCIKAVYECVSDCVKSLEKSKEKVSVIQVKPTKKPTKKSTKKPIVADESQYDDDISYKINELCNGINNHGISDSDEGECDDIDVEPAYVYHQHKQQMHMGISEDDEEDEAAANAFASTFAYLVPLNSC